MFSGINPEIKLLPHQVNAIAHVLYGGNLKRWDIAYKLLLLFAKSIHWFNPLVWWMVREASHNLELCCDDDVLRWRDKEFRHLYGEILLRTAQAAGAMPVLSTRFSNGKNQMKGRLMNMFQNKRNSVLLVCLAFIATLLLGSLLVCESAEATFFDSHVSDEEAFELLTAEQAAAILKEQLILAYENTYGEYLPAEEKPNGVVDDSEYLAWVIPHLELSDEDDQYYIFDVIFPFLVDKKTGVVFKHYNGLDPFTIPFDPTDTYALAFAG